MAATITSEFIPTIIIYDLYDRLHCSAIFYCQQTIGDKCKYIYFKYFDQAKNENITNDKILILNAEIADLISKRLGTNINPSKYKVLYMIPSHDVDCYTISKYRLYEKSPLDFVHKIFQHYNNKEMALKTCRNILNDYKNIMACNKQMTNTKLYHLCKDFERNIIQEINLLASIPVPSYLEQLHRILYNNSSSNFASSKYLMYAIVNDDEEYRFMDGNEAMQFLIRCLNYYFQKNYNDDLTFKSASEQVFKSTSGIINSMPRGYLHDCFSNVMFMPCHCCRYDCMGWSFNTTPNDYINDYRRYCKYGMYNGLDDSRYVNKHYYSRRLCYRLIHPINFHYLNKRGTLFFIDYHNEDDILLSKYKKEKIVKDLNDVKKDFKLSILLLSVIKDNRVNNEINACSGGMSNMDDRNNRDQETNPSETSIIKPKITTSRLLYYIGQVIRFNSFSMSRLLYSTGDFSVGVGRSIKNDVNNIPWETLAWSEEHTRRIINIISDELIKYLLTDLVVGVLLYFITTEIDRNGEDEIMKFEDDYSISKYRIVWVCAKCNKERANYGSIIHDECFMNSVKQEFDNC